MIHTCDMIQEKRLEEHSWIEKKRYVIYHITSRSWMTVTLSILVSQVFLGTCDTFVWWWVVGFSRAGLAVILVTGSSLLLPPPSLPRGRPEATYGRSFPPNTSCFSLISQPGRARKLQLKWEVCLVLGDTGGGELRRTVTRLEARTSQSATQPPKHLICKPVKDYGCQNEKCESLSVKVTQLRLILIQKNSRTYLAGDSGELPARKEPL